MSAARVKGLKRTHMGRREFLMAAPRIVRSYTAMVRVSEDLDRDGSDPSNHHSTQPCWGYEVTLRPGNGASQC